MTESQQRYRVVEKLESGGMAEVFRAESEGLQGFKKQVAIKRVLPQLSEKKKFISMFLDEARLSAQLSHSNCVQVFDIGVGDNAYFIVMEFVDGANLKTIAESLKKQGREFPVNAAVFVALEICKGLAYAHEMRDSNGNEINIVHRDMSPPNVLVTKFGEIKIVDFGLAKANSQLEKSEPGIIKGKFSYLSPEAAMGQEVDLRTDIFAVGIILWELLTGQRLFLGETDFQTVKKVQQAVVPPASGINKRVPPELERIVARSLARDPAQRYQTARELGQQLSKFLFAYGQPVSTFDIATLVQGAMRDRQKGRMPQGSIIDKLIEEALLEFTSLTEDEAAPASEAAKRSHMSSVSGADPFVDPTDWANEIGNLGGPPSSRASIPPSAYQDGNLSALEDESIGSVRAAGEVNKRGTLKVPTPAPSQARASTTGTGPASSRLGGGVPLLETVPGGTSSTGRSGAFYGAVVAALAAAAIGVAWMAHLIPH
jgi:serine/threonine-protein kinase